MESERITAIYDEIAQYGIALEPDPASLGPKYLADIIARCRNFLNATHRLVQEVHRERHTVQRELTALEAAYDIDASDLLANDERVRRLPNIDDRKATVAVVLRDRLHVIQELRGTIEDLEIVDKAVRFRHRELRDTMAEIKVQRSLIRDELDTKSFYGDERSSDVGGTLGGLNVVALEALLNESAEQSLSVPLLVAAPSDAGLGESRSLDVSLQDCDLNGLLCVECSEPQYATSGGATCCNGHGGAEGVEPTSELVEEPQADGFNDTAEVAKPAEMTDADFDTILQNV